MLNNYLNIFKNKKTKKYTLVLLVLVCVGILAPYLANDKPLCCKYKGYWLFPALSSKNYLTITDSNNNTEVINYNMGKQWKLVQTDFILFSACAYSPNSIDAENAPMVSPFNKQYFLTKNEQLIQLPINYRHWLGTTQNGTDVLSNVIYGTRVALLIGFFSMLIAGTLGLFLGAIAGYYENTILKIGIVQLIILIPSILISWFYAFITQENNLKQAFESGGIALMFQFIVSITTFSSLLFLMLFLASKLDLVFNTSKKIKFPIDTFITKTIEVLNSIPSLLLIITIVSIAKPSITLLILIIGLLSWTGIARIVRAEYIREKNLEYAISAKAMGLKNWRIMFKHIFPNIKNTLIIQLIFGIASAIIIEASLSFIGIGTPIETASWGKTLNEARNNINAWWLVLAPGIMIFIVTFSCYKISELLKDN